MPPIVFINGRFLMQRITGVQRYARETLAGLDALLATAAGEGAPRFVVLAPRGTVFPRLSCVGTRHVGRLQGHAWEQFELPLYAAHGLLFSFGATGPLLKRQQMVTVHDASVYRVADAFSLQFRAWYRLCVGAVVRRAPRTVAVSQFGVGEIVRFFGGEASRISVVTEGWQHLERIDTDDEVFAKHGLQPGTYVLAVSSPTPNKNFGLVLRAAERLRASGIQFAVVGAADPKVFADARLQSAENVRQLGYVSDAELKALYARAMCFVFPSRYEGFGIPPLEAMSCGCPVLVSDIPPLREVCGDVAEYFDPGDEDALVRLIEQRAAAPVTSEGRDRVRAQAGRFSWTRGAELNLEAVRDCLRQ